MDYLKRFLNHSGYTEYLESGNMIKPNVSYCEDASDVHYNPFADTAHLMWRTFEYDMEDIEEGIVHVQDNFLTDNGKLILFERTDTGEIQVVMDYPTYPVATYNDLQYTPNWGTVNGVTSFSDTFHQTFTVKDKTVTIVNNGYDFTITPEITEFYPSNG